jgi:hypothetical protein
VSKRAADFLNNWIDENIHAGAYPQDRKEGKVPAETCIAEAKTKGISKQELEEAAGDDLTSYMFSALEKAADSEVDRLVAKDH